MGNKLILCTMKFATLIALTATDTAACGEAAPAIAENADNVANAYCAHAITTAAVEAVDADADAGTEAVEAADASFSCAMLSIASTDEVEDIRVATADTPDATPAVQNEAWAWDAGVALDALVAAEGDADSAKMIGSAIAAVATIAAVAF